MKETSNIQMSLNEDFVLHQNTHHLCDDSERVHTCSARFWSEYNLNIIGRKQDGMNRLTWPLILAPPSDKELGGEASMLLMKLLASPWKQTCC